MLKIKKLTPAKIAFLSVSKSVWHKISDRHNYKIHYSETALTDEIIHQLLKKNIPNLGIHKAINENLYGHDIEIVIQQHAGGHIKLSLQAKVMYYDPKRASYLKVVHKVKDPDNKSNEIFQWDLLDRNAYERIPFYLFYNGFSKDRYSKLVPSKSTNVPVSNGCTVLPFKVFKQRFLKATTTGLQLRFSPTNFNYCNINNTLVNGDNAFPWHKLFHPPFNYLKEAVDANVGVKVHEGYYKVDSSKYITLDSNAASPTEVDNDYIIDPNFEEYKPKYIVVLKEPRNDFLERFLKDL